MHALAPAGTVTPAAATDERTYRNTGVALGSGLSSLEQQVPIAIRSPHPVPARDGCAYEMRFNSASVRYVKPGGANAGAMPARSQRIRPGTIEFGQQHPPNAASSALMKACGWCAR